VPIEQLTSDLVDFGDAFLGEFVASITNAAFWSKGNNTIAIIYDEGDNDDGCCDANPGGVDVTELGVQERTFS
jgi:hypothetical protein